MAALGIILTSVVKRRPLVAAAMDDNVGGAVRLDLSVDDQVSL